LHNSKFPHDIAAALGELRSVCILPLLPLAVFSRLLDACFLHTTREALTKYSKRKNVSAGEAFVETDQRYLQADTGANRDDGCTAVTAVLVGNSLVVAHVGDSRAVLSRNGKGTHSYSSANLAYFDPRMANSSALHPQPQHLYLNKI
jgi:hypothetical protein